MLWHAAKHPHVLVSICPLLLRKATWVQIQIDLEKITNILSKPVYSSAHCKFILPSLQGVEVSKKYCESVFCTEPGPWKILSKRQQHFQRKALRITFPPNDVKNIGVFQKVLCAFDFIKLIWLYDLKTLHIICKMWRSWRKRCYSTYPKHLIFRGRDKSKVSVRDKKVNQTNCQTTNRKEIPRSPAAMRTEKPTQILSLRLTDEVLKA